MAGRATIIGSIFGLPPGLRPAAGAPLAGSKAARAQVPVGWVRLQPDDLPDLAVFCELTNLPDVDAGYGGIVSVDRPLDEALTRFQGFAAMTAPLELTLDGTDRDQPIDDLYDNLEALAGRGRKRLPGRPPQIIVDTAGLFRHDTSTFPDVRWWLSGLSWSQDEDDQLTDSDGHRLLAVANVTITKVVEATAIQGRALKKRLAHQAKTPTGKKTYTAVEGDNLMSIARKKLGDAGRWQELGDLNGIRDPYNVQAGAKITLP